MSQGSLNDRIADLEAQQADVLAAISQISEAEARWLNKPGVRLAITAIDPGDSSYPSEGSGANVFWIQFVDATYTATVGAQTVSKTKRAVSAAQFKACNITGGWLPVGSMVAAFFQNSRWWFASLSTSSETAIIAIDGTDGSSVSPNANCLWPGKIVGLSTGAEAFCSDPWTPTPTIDGDTVDEVDIWFTAIDKPGGSGTGGVTLIGGDRYFAEFNGFVTVSGDTRPLYAARKGTSPAVVKRFVLYTDLAWGSGSATAKSVLWDSGASTWVDDPGGTTFTLYDPWLAVSGQSAWVGKTGFHGWYQYNQDSNRNEIVWMEHQAKFIYFSATSGPFSGTVTATVDDFSDGRNPGSTVTLTDPQNQFPRMLAGATGNAHFDPETGHYIVDQCQTQAGFIKFTLATGQSLSGGSGTINSLSSGDYYGTQQDVQDPSPLGTLTVYDKSGNHPRAVAGCTGTASLDVVTGHYNVLECDQLAIKLRGTAGGTLTNSTSSISLSSPTVMSPKPFSKAPTGTVTVYNVLGYACDSTDIVIADWNDNTGHWEITGVAQHVQTALTNIQYDTSGHQIQVKTRDVVGMFNGAESSYTNKIAFTQITYATSVSWTGTVLKYHTHTVYALQDADVGDTTIDTPDSC